MMILAIALLTVIIFFSLPNFFQNFSEQIITFNNSSYEDWNLFFVSECGISKESFEVHGANCGAWTDRQRNIWIVGKPWFTYATISELCAHEVCHNYKQDFSHLIMNCRTDNFECSRMEEAYCSNEGQSVEKYINICDNLLAGAVK